MATKLRKPRLTQSILKGISAACANGLAGDVADLTGGGPEPTDEEQKTWDNVEAAQAWVRAMFQYRAQKKRAPRPESPR